MNIKKLILVILLLSFVYCEQAKKQKIVLEISSFQTEIEGKKTDLYQLKNEKIEVYITNYGGRIVSLLSPNRSGKMGDVVLGFKSIGDYQKAKTPYHGCLIGRYGNRIGKGKFNLNGTTYELPIKVLVLNNYGDGMVMQWQRLFFKGRLSASDKSLRKKNLLGFHLQEKKLIVKLIM